MTSLSAAISSLALSMHAVSPHAATEESVLKQGWVLKKRRRRMQGFALRYFKLYSSGILSYAVHPDMPPRDQIQLASAVISSFPPPCTDVHIDSDHSTFHIKFKSLPEFQKWMKLFRSFVPGPTAPSSSALSTPQFPINDVLGNLGLAIHELRASFTAITLDQSPGKQQAQKQKKDKDPNILSVLKDGEGFFHKFRKNSSHDIHSYAPEEQEPAQNEDVPSKFKRLRLAIDNLSEQYDLLVKGFSTLPQHPRTPFHDTVHGTVIHRRRLSIRTTMSGNQGDDSSVWYDATDGVADGEEVILSNELADEPLSLMDDDSSGLGEKDALIIEERPTPADRVIRREKLPSPVVVAEGSLFLAFKKNIGKDLSNMSFPVAFNEPISLLQRLCEDTEYVQLLDKAVLSDNPVDRLSYVAAFAVSGFACTKMRTGRKSFTPMMGETFEDTRTNFIAEKVSHSPLIMACYASGNGWQYWCTHSGKTKFWGKSLEVVQTGTTHLVIGEDHYQWQRPSTFVRNLMLGPKYLEHCGQLVITNGPGKHRCQLDFKETGYWGGTPNVVAGEICDDKGEVHARLEGTWHEQLTRAVDPTHLEVLWKSNPWPRDTSEYYGLTPFAMALNEITPDIANKLPMTDSRYRPDIRAMEEGKQDIADQEKIRLEETQRLRRERGDALLEPKWFTRVAGTDEFEYRGGYWEQRGRGWASREPVW